jgi:uncharacterized protein (TIGR02147 family)
MKKLPFRLFDYLDYREYLHALFEYKKKHEARFSGRAFARLCGSSASHFYTLLIGRKVGLKPEQQETLAQSLKLTKKEHKYLKLLVAYDNAKTFDQRDNLYQSILKLKLTAVSAKVEKKQYQYYAKWYHSVVRALLGYYPFYPAKDDYNRLGRQVRPVLSGTQVKGSISLLTKLGLIKTSEDGRLVQTNQVISTGPGPRDLQITKFLKQIMHESSDALDVVPFEQREISALTMNISQESFDRIKAKIIQTRKEIMEIARQSTGDDRVCRCGFQFYPVTRHKGAK